MNESFGRLTLGLLSICQSESPSLS